MRRFLRYFFLFISPLLLYVVFFEIYLRGITTSYSAKENGLSTGNTSIEVLILGNSHAFYGIDPHQFTFNAYNSAQVYQSLYFDKRITLKHLDQLSHLKYVIISIDYHSLYYSTQTARDIWSYYANGIEYKDRLPFKQKISRLYGYTNEIALNFLKKDKSHRYDTLKVLDLPDNVDFGKSISKGYYYFTGTNESGMQEKYIKERADLFNGQVSGSNEKEEIKADLEDFISQLQLRKINPILVTIPCYRPYRMLLNQEHLEKNESEIEELAAKYNIPYWNYLDLPLNVNQFIDCDHLNKDGAVTFSKLLNSRVNEIIVDTTGSLNIH